MNTKLLLPLDHLEQKLTEEEETALYFYVYKKDPCSLLELMEWYRPFLPLHERMAKVREINQKLYALKLIVESNRYDWSYSGFLFKVNPLYFLPLCRLTFPRHLDWLDKFQVADQSLNSLYHWGLMACFDGRTSFEPMEYTENNLKALVSAFLHPEMEPFLLGIPAQEVGGLVYHTVETAALLDDVYLLQKLYDYLEKREDMPEDIWEECYAHLALFQYFAGEVYIPHDEVETYHGLLLQSARATYARDFKAAIHYAEKAFKQPYAKQWGKHVLDNFFSCYLLIMAYYLEGSAASRKKLKSMVKGGYLRYGGMEQLEMLANYLADGAQQRILLEPNTRIEKEILERGNFTYKNLFWFFYRSYMTGRCLVEFGVDYEPEYALMRSELSKFIGVPPQERKELEKKLEGAPLLTSVYVKQDWEVLLDQLDALGDMESTKKDEIFTRLIYVIHTLDHVEIREQTMLKDGTWSVGKGISYSRYLAGDLSYMNDADKAILTQVQLLKTYKFNVGLVLPYLVGSDKVFYQGEKHQLLPVNVTEENPYIVLENEGMFIALNGNFEAKDPKSQYVGEEVIITKKNDGCYTVYRFTRKQKLMYLQLVQQKLYPPTAEEQLKAFFHRHRTTLSLQSTVIDHGDTARDYESEGHICLRVLPRKDHYIIDCFAQPLPGGNQLFVPGSGMAIVIDEKDGVRYRIKRHLRLESDNYSVLTDFVEEHCTQAVNNANRMLVNAEQLLSILEYIQPLSEIYSVEWPEGEGFKIKTMGDAREWDIHLVGHNHWFDIEGNVQFSDQTLLPMAELLELLGKSKGRYIKLTENEFIALSDSLRKQLGKLEAIAVNQKGKLQLTAFQAGLLGDDILDGDFQIHYDEHLQQLREKVAASAKHQVKVPAQLHATLRDYQLEGFQWMARLNSWGAGACLADDMGLGKTLQSIAYLLHMAKKGPSLVVAPASVVPNWRKEIERFAPALQVSVLNDSEDREKTIKKAKKMEVVLTSYGLLNTESEMMISKKWNVICLDEAHAIKNRETKTSAVVMQLQGENRLILTGTPIQNHLGELWNLFQFINPGLLGSYEHFQRKFIQPIEQYHDKQRQLQLNRIVHPFMLRRTKQEVVDELPDKEEIVLPVELSDDEMKVYEVIRRRAKQMIEEGGAKVNVATLAEITRLRQAACCASLAEKKWKGECSKINQLMEILAELKSGGNRALIFSQFTSFFKLVRKALDAAGESYLYLDGSVSIKQREQLVKEFQEGNCPFFLISLKAGGLGLNLTAANYIIHLDPWWNPAIEQQATDRAYRIGQSQKVTAYHLIAAHTIEEKILKLHKTKRNLADALLDGTDMSHQLTAEDLMDILSEG